MPKKSKSVYSKRLIATLSGPLSLAATEYALRQGFAVPLALTLDYGNTREVELAQSYSERRRIPFQRIDISWYRSLAPAALPLLAVVTASAFSEKLNARGVITGLCPSRRADIPGSSEFFVVLQDRVWRSILRVRRFMIFAPFAAMLAYDVGKLCREHNIPVTEWFLCRCERCRECRLNKLILEGYQCAPR